MVVRMAMTSYDQIPDKLAEYCLVEYTMPQTVVSHATIRSVSVQDSDSDDPPEKYVRYLSRYEYQYGKIDLNLHIKLTCKSPCLKI